MFGYYQIKAIRPAVATCTLAFKRQTELSVNDSAFRISLQIKRSESERLMRACVADAGSLAGPQAGLCGVLV